MLIKDLTITPIAFSDPPLLNSVGVHEPLALRTIVQLELDNGTVGLGEGSGELTTLDGLRAAREKVLGLSVFDTSKIEKVVNDVLGGDSGALSRQQRRSIFSILEVACLDAQGKALGIPVCDLLGGAVRDSVAFSAYLFYKWAEHPASGAGPAIADNWGAAIDPQGIVTQARQLIDTYGFKSVKLKAGVFPVDQEIAAIRALANAFPGYPLRIDPNGAWSVETSQFVARELEGVLEYLEDPTLTLDGMAEVASHATMPLATNMCVTAFEHLKEAVQKDSVQIVLSDHHFWGGLQHTRELGAICDAFGIGLSMHSNSHLGISLAAMTHVAAATPNLSYACDTHYPWNSAEDIIIGGPIPIIDGNVEVSRAPGLGIELDLEALQRQHKVYLDSGRTTRDDTSYMRTVVPDYNPLKA